MNGEAITGSNDLVQIVTAKKAGDTLKLSVYRQGQTLELTVTVAEQNLNPKLFDYYYSRMGGSWAGSTWDKSKLLSY